MPFSEGRFFLAVPGHTHRDQADEALCPFCDGLNPGNPDARFNQSYPELMGESQVLEEFTRMRVLLDVYPIAPDHVVIIPHNESLASHITAINHLDPESQKQFLQAVQQVKAVTKSPFHIEFEHGTGLDHSSGVEKSLAKSVFHAHWHMVPCAQSLFKASVAAVRSEIASQNQFEFHQHRLENETELFIVMNATIKGRPYLILKEGLNLLIVVETGNSSIKSQFFRKLIAELIMGEDAIWDWKNMNPTQREKLSHMLRTTIDKFRNFSGRVVQSPIETKL